MKVECLSDGYISLTEGKVYNVVQLDSSTETILLEDDDGDFVWFEDKDFKLLPEVGAKREKVALKDFLASMPEDSHASVMFGIGGTISIYAYDLEFDCKSEERAEEVYAALITLFKE